MPDYNFYQLLTIKDMCLARAIALLIIQTFPEEGGYRDEKIQEISRIDIENLYNIYAILGIFDRINQQKFYDIVVILTRLPYQSGYDAAEKLRLFMTNDPTFNIW